LTDVLLPQYVSTIVPADASTNDWLSQFLALRDVSQFVVGASIQYNINQEKREVKLQQFATMTRNEVLHALDRIRMPQHLSKADMVANFSDIFRVILPDTPNLVRRNSEASEDEFGLDAIDALCAKLNDRQVVNRASDREVMHNISKVTRNITLLDDPAGHFNSAHPKIYALNCKKCHVVGDSQLRYSGDIKFPVRPELCKKLSSSPARKRIGSNI
jgi:hypothetical protein